MAKRAMMYLNISRTARLPASRRQPGKLHRLTVLSAVCAGALLVIAPIGSLLAADTAAKVVAGGKATRGAATPAPFIPAAAASAASCPALESGAELPMSRRPIDVRERLRSGADGARARLREMPVREVSRGVLVDLVLRQNLTVRSSAESIAIAKALVTQSDAAFDPTLFSSLSYTKTKNVQRVDTFGRLYDQDAGARLDAENQRRQAMLSGSDTSVQDAALGNDKCLPPVNVGGLSVSNPGCQLPPVYLVQPELAWFNSNSDHRATGSLGAGLNFIVGGSANVAVSSTWHKPIAMSGGGVPTNTTAIYPTDLTFDPYGWNTKLFWTSAASAALTMPLPFTKNFGTEGNAGYYSYQVAQSGDRKAGWNERSARNSALEQGLQGYWDAIQALQSLRALIDLREVLVERTASQKRLFDGGLATRYDLSQLEAQQSALDAQEEAAWSQLLTVSNRLDTLVASDQRVLMLPNDAEALLKAPVTLPQATGYEQALLSHPDIKAQEEDHDASKLSLAFRENQDLPDISFSASYSVGQTDAVYGYPSLPQSLVHLAAPDTSNLFVGIRYHLPIGMNATGAALDRARLEERQAYDRTRQVRQRVVGSVDQAMGDARSAELVVHRSVEDMKLAQCSYDRARDQRELGLVAEFEVLNKYQDLVTARLGLISAQVSFRKAYVHLLAAQGTLEQDYVR